jgi:uncharacterized protein (DUF305 family)
MKSPTAFVAAVAAALFLASCSAPASDGHTEHDAESATSAAALPAGVNDADVTFATDMIPHHRQAVALSALVPSRSTDPAVITLAAEISAAQSPEIETMKGFLAAWHRSPSDGPGSMPGMQMQGMVDDATMTRLESLRGNEFDTLWLSSMIGHHEGAIAMANTELADGASADAKELAQRIVTAQKGEIDRMKKMGASTDNG